MKEFIVWDSRGYVDGYEESKTGIPEDITVYTAMAKGEEFKVKIYQGSGSAKKNIFGNPCSRHIYNKPNYNEETWNSIEKWKKYVVVQCIGTEYEDEPREKKSILGEWFYSKEFFSYVISKDESYKLYKKGVEYINSAKENYRLFISDHYNIFELVEKDFNNKLEQSMNQLTESRRKSIKTGWGFKPKSTGCLFNIRITNKGIYVNDICSSYIKCDWSKFGMADITDDVKICSIGLWLKDLIKDYVYDNDIINVKVDAEFYYSINKTFSITFTYVETVKLNENKTILSEW